jgi:hypothetical protein
VSLRAGVDATEKRIILPLPEIEPDYSARILWLYRLTYRGYYRIVNNIYFKIR